MTGTLETPISLQKLKREDTTKYVLGDEHGHCREPLENVQNTGKKTSFSGMFIHLLQFPTGEGNPHHLFKTRIYPLSQESV